MGKVTDKWVQGYICAIAVMIQLDGIVTTRTKDAFKSGVGNMKLSALAKRGVAEFDLQLLKKHWKDLK